MLQLEKDCYKLVYDSLVGWVVHTPAGNSVHFSKDGGLCGGMPYIKLIAHLSSNLNCDPKNGVAFVETVSKNYEASPSNI